MSFCLFHFPECHGNNKGVVQGLEMFLDFYNTFIVVWGEGGGGGGGNPMLLVVEEYH